MRTPDSLISSADGRHLIYCEATVAHITALQDLGLGPKFTRPPLVGLDTAPNLACDIDLQGSVFRSAHAEQKQIKSIHSCSLARSRLTPLLDGDLNFGAISEARWLAAGCACRDKSPGVNIDVVLGV
jgi:hypothetical protein